MNVVEAAERRIVNVFSNGLPVYMSFSGGKDSLCLATLTMNLIKQGLIDPKLLRVHFVDEEAIFDCIERTVMKWRRMFLAVGASFDWLCLESCITTASPNWRRSNRSSVGTAGSRNSG